MTLTPALRKTAYMAHLVFSIGWLGAVAAYLALAVTGLQGQDLELARSAYISMEFVGWAVIVPLALASLLSGLVQSLGTEWGLFRHYWISAKFLLATAGSLILLSHMKVVGQMSDIARTTSLGSGLFGGLRVQLVVHAVGGLLLLLTATALSIYKPWGLTPYGRGTRRIPTKTLAILGILLSLLAIHHLLGGGPRHH